MGLYNDRILPHLIALTMRNPNLAPYRRRVVSQAEGRVLEIGIGAGTNLPLYSARVDEVVGIEPASRLVAMARSAANGSAVPVTVVMAAAAAMPFDAASFDTAVMTWTLCSVPEPIDALVEIRRVLKPGGRLLFIEHGLAPDDPVRRWQHRLTPIWKRVAGGCHLDRPINTLISAAGYRLEMLETGYMPGPRPMTFMYEGSARSI